LRKALVDVTLAIEQERKRNIKMERSFERAKVSKIKRCICQK
jgi:hypothetical protein